MNDTPWLMGTLEAHNDEAAIDRFAAALKEKMAASRAKGRSGWQDCDEEELLRMLNHHLEKGDMRDIAILAMMIWHNAGVAAGLI